MTERVDRRLAAIVAADVSGFSRLVAADEEATLGALRAHRGELIDPTIAAHGGRIANTAGDSVLSEFPSAVDAVRCAIALQEGMAARNADVAEDRRIQFRIGINVGDVVAEGDDLLGDGVNVAARIEALAEPGGICLSRTARDQVRDRLDLTLDDLGSVEVKNIARPVRAFRVRLGGAAGDAPSIAAAKTPGFFRRWRWAIAGAGGAVVAAIAVVLVLLEPWVPREEPADPAKMAFALPDKPSIAVLPFDNLTDDPDWFADGMTDNLITDLSNVAGLFVIARNSTFTYKGRAVQVRQVAEELGVRYVLEGSVQRAGGQVRINAQLIDATTGGHVWSDRFDRANEDLFALQDEVIAKIIAALPIVSPPAAKPSRVPTANLDAYDFYLRGKQTLDNLDLRDLKRSIEMFELALELDPNFALARAALARAYTNMGQYGLWRTDNDPDVDLGAVGYVGALEAIQRALADDPELALAHALRARMWTVTFFRLDEGRFTEALRSAERAVALAPNDADVLVDYGVVLSATGEHLKALEIIQEALRINPKPPPRYAIDLGWVLFQLGRYSEAVQSANQFREEVSYGFSGSQLLAAAHAHLGNLDEAKAHIAIVLENRPQFHLEKSDKGNWKWTSYKKDVDRGRIIEGLRLAGAPIFENGVEPRGTRLQQDEIEKLLTGQTISGRDVISGVQWWRKQGADGSSRNWDSEGGEATGRFTVEDGWACWEWDVADDFKRCNRVYRDPMGTAERLDEFLMAGTGCICGFAVERPADALPLPDKPSIAVLPFNNLSGDSEQDYFVDGMTETLITDLSKVPGLFVIARNTSFTYKGRAVDVKAVGRELGVRYIVEGSVQRSGDQVRINAQLIDAIGGGHLWAERYDGSPVDVFGLQDRVAEQIVLALAGELTPQEELRISQIETDNVAAHDAFLLGLSYYNRRTPHDNAKAAVYFKKAVELDADYVAAYTALAKVYALVSKGGLEWAGALKISFRQAPSEYWRFLELGMKRPSSDNHLVRSWLALTKLQYDRAIAEAEQALELGPNNNEAFEALAEALIYAGRPREGIAFAHNAMRLNPTLPAKPLYLMGVAEFALGNTEKAAEFLERAREHAPDITYYAGLLAAIYGELGFVEKAKAARNDFAKGFRATPGLKWSMLMFPFAEESVLARLAAGFRIAGAAAPDADGTGYLPLHQGNKLRGAEIKSLLFGREIFGRDFWETRTWKQRRTPSGELEHTGFPVHVGVNKASIGVSRIEGDMVCDLWPELYKTLELCVVIYRNPEGTFHYDSILGAMTLDYLMVTETGAHPFSPVE